MNSYAGPIARLINEFSKLPGIGKRTAERLAYYIIETDTEEAIKLSNAIIETKEKIKFCSKCFNLAEDELCEICQSTKRDSTTICVVESPKDIISIERTKEYIGMFHVLHGHISPMDGIGPDDIKLRELIQRVRDDNIKEVIVATNPTVEGEATSMYISKLLKFSDAKVTRLAHGIPIGGNLEYTDEMTLTKAFEGRIEI
ncbi:recombination mediator RecR [Clostridiaceae bacterium HSG29]|nr:recombination mediator RecR [Clostridiaceae bacterium HSG29]